MVRVVPKVISDRDLYEALVTVRNYCLGTDCTKCSMSVFNGSFFKCGLKDNDNLPSKWILVEPHDYKAFKEEDENVSKVEEKNQS